MSEPLPDLLARIAAAAGEEAALLVAKEWGGRVLYLPKKFSSEHRLAEVVGERKARAIFEEVGHGPFMVPMGNVAGPAKRRRLVSELLDQGSTHSAAAGAAGVHTRTVERVARRKREEVQGKLL